MVQPLLAGMIDEPRQFFVHNRLESPRGRTGSALFSVGLLRKER